jgi:hypothetical protein
VIPEFQHVPSHACGDVKVIASLPFIADEGRVLRPVKGNGRASEIFCRFESFRQSCIERIKTGERPCPERVRNSAAANSEYFRLGTQRDHVGRASDEGKIVRKPV